MANPRIGRIYLKCLVVIALIALSAVVWWQKGIPLGLDLKGGTELLYRVRTEDLSQDQKHEVVERTIAVISKRIDPEGSKEISIRPHGEDRFYIQLPAMNKEDSSRIENLIRRAGKLRFSLVSDNREDYVTARSGEPIPGYVPYLPVEWEKNRPVRWRRGTYGEVAEQPAEVGNDQWYLIDNDPEHRVGGEDLANCEPTTDRTGLPAVGFTFRGKGVVQFERLTEQFQGRQLAIILDQDLYSAPRIDERISGQGIIRGKFTRAEVNDLVAVLRAGSLPADIELEWNNSIGAQLGEDSIRAGKRAAMIAVILVLGFMALYYLLTGVIADFAVMLNLLLVLGVMASLQMVLTLPGIAGLVLTLGMAVDANVLINERIREERERGKTLALAIRGGYQRAFITILDSNLTTLITAFVLFGIGTEAVKGFARTLSVGIAVSMFTSVWVTRVIIELLIETGWLKALHILPVLARPHVPFSRIRRLTMAGSALLIAVGLMVFVGRGEQIYDTDMTGGFRAEMQLKSGLRVADVRKRVSGVFEKADVQTVWGPGEERGEALPTRFAIRIRKLSDAQKREKMRADVQRVLEAGGLLGTVETVVDADDLWRFNLSLSGAVDEEHLRRLLWEAGYHDSNIKEAIPTDAKAPEAEVRMRPAALDPKDAGHQYALVLEALDDMIVSRDVKLVEIGDPMRPLPGEAGEGIIQAGLLRVPMQLGDLCHTPALRDAIIRDLLGGERPEDPQNLRVYSTEDGPGDETRQIDVWTTKKIADHIRSTARTEIRVYSFTVPASQEVLHIWLNSPQAETVLRDRLNEAGLLAVFSVDKDGKDKVEGLVRTVIALKAPAKRYDLHMLRLSGDKVKEKIREDLLALFADEVGATSVVAALSALESLPDVPDPAELEPDTHRFFRVAFDKPVRLQEVQNILQRAGYPQALIVDSGLRETLGQVLGKDARIDLNRSEVATQRVSEVVVGLPADEEALAEARQKIVGGFAKANPQDAFRSVNTIGSSVSKEMRQRAFYAVIVSCVAIIFYIWFRFGEVKFGLAAVLALVHDVLLAIGAVGLADALSGTAVGESLGFSDIKVNATMIAAFLTLIGYSINDTIVVFDRIRENMGGARRRVDASLVDLSINQVFSRTLLTSTTTLMALLTLYIVGGPVIHGFAFVMAFGVIVGTYSSIFIASPILIGWESFMSGLRKLSRIVTFHTGGR